MLLTFPPVACSAAAVEDWQDLSRIACTAWHDCWPWPAKAWEVAHEPADGLSAAITRWAGWRRSRPSTRNWARARWKIFWAALSLAGLVDASLSRAAGSLLALAVRWRRRLSLWRAMVEPRNATRICLRAPVFGHARIFCSS